MNPSIAAVAELQAKITDWTPSDSLIADSLNAPAVANPTPQGTTAKPFTIGGVFTLVSPAALSKLLPLPCLTDIRNKIAANDTAGCAIYVQLLVVAGVITAGEAQAIAAMVAATEPDPSYQAQISWAAANLGRPVDAADVAAARPTS